jgi:hypothetical protein
MHGELETFVDWQRLRPIDLDRYADGDGQNPNPSSTPAFPLSPATDMPAKLAWAAMCCQVRTHAPQQITRVVARLTLFNHFVGDGEQPGREGKAERLGGLQVDDELELCRLHDW